MISNNAVPPLFWLFFKQYNYNVVVFFTLSDGMFICELELVPLIVLGSFDFFVFLLIV